MSTPVERQEVNPPVPRDATAPPRGRPAMLVATAVALEIFLILPFVDRLADRNPTVHFTQHGLIFAGGVLMGIALREVMSLVDRR